jgi:tetratricopeptide (TPR) repeat protein
MKTRILCVLAILSLAAPLAAAQDEVKCYEQQVVIPTYLIGPPDPNPQFYTGGASQGAEHRIYPYPLYDNLTTQKADKTYTLVYLENQYIKVGILPEIGGKIFEAIDKTNGYNFIYRQHVIKPALISLLGAWISGGIEWDIPHHHRATSFLPVPYTTEQGSDGSKTVWVGELELRDRMRWAVGITLHPGKSLLEASFRMINRTPLPTSMLCFSNVAVSVNNDYQVIFPPSTQHVTYHAKRDFTTWPIATTVFNGTDFTAGVDVSWYKNHYSAMSMFAWNYQDDFLAGYDHGKHAGIMSVADHNVVPGKKFWTWGNGPRGRMEDKLLTDSDGPYIELMVGAYSDNQPDYTWLQPFETRTWTQNWYPFRDIDGVKNANTDAAVNLEVKDGKAIVGFQTTSAYRRATVSLKLKDQVLLSEEVAIDPGKPYVNQVALPDGADEHDLRAAITVEGRELVGYSPVKLVPEPMPKVITPPPAPEEIKTNEELYLVGLRIEQFHDPQHQAEPYYLEAIKRDPRDIRANTALAIDYIKQARYADAETLLRNAIARATANYTTPKDAEPFYYLGLTLKAQGKIDEAYTSFLKSTWSAAWRSPGYFEAAEIDCMRGDAGGALALLDHSLESNALNIRALRLKSSLGDSEETAIQKLDPLESSDLSPQPNEVLETAAEDMEAGLWQDGTAWLEHWIVAEGENAKVSPLSYYYLAYFAHQLNQPDKALEFDKLAGQLPTDYVFPFQREAIDVLESAMRDNPADSHAPYYLGNLLFDWQPQRAVQLWEQAVALGADFPVVYRNLADYYTRQGNARDKALAYLEKAAQLGGNAMVFNDLDKLYEANSVAPDKRLAMMESHQGVLDRDDVISREINLKIFAGKADDAIALLNARFFHVWEGSGQYAVGDSWTNALLERGRQKLAAGRFSDALSDFQAATVLPDNLIEATLPTARLPEINYWIGTAYAGLGEMDKARQAWQASADGTAPAVETGRGRGFGRGGLGRGMTIAAGTRVLEAVPYYQALSLQKLGRDDDARRIFEKLAQAGQQTADSHYLAGLGNLGLNQPDKAKQELNLALQGSPDHLGAKVALESIAQ